MREGLFGLLDQLQRLRGGLPESEGDDALREHMLGLRVDLRDVRGNLQPGWPLDRDDCRRVCGCVREMRGRVREVLRKRHLHGGLHGMCEVVQGVCEGLPGGG